MSKAHARGQIHDRRRMSGDEWRLGTIDPTVRAPGRGGCTGSVPQGDRDSKFKIQNSKFKGGDVAFEF
ncbi:hypothetical protein [Thioalkalivibrio sulfidiphilus]|uniref:hypothetical protein n=1 Tax=Thioalkalivibrio sulfidiphilus TaxID=1033854 RepID=UPI003BAFB7B9